MLPTREEPPPYVVCVTCAYNYFTLKVEIRIVCEPVVVWDVVTVSSPTQKHALVVIEGQSEQ